MADSRPPFDDSTPVPHAQAVPSAKARLIGEETSSSRNSDQGAGWACRLPGTYGDLMPPKTKRKSWFNPGMLWRSRNDIFARVSDPVDEERRAWVEGLSDADLTVDLSDQLEDFSFLLLGDTGEGDESQYALIPSLLSQEPVAFLSICSDVLYPIGDVNDYSSKFYQPYQNFPGPIYALPGNHDWYDNLFAFMYHFCGRTTAPAAPKRRVGGKAPFLRSLAAKCRRLLWRKAAQPDEKSIAAMVAMRGLPVQKQQVRQKGPYFVIDTKQLRLVCIDTGILGNLDEQQGQWLLRVSRDPRPKILLTGKPLLVDGECHACDIAGAPEGYDDVLKIVHEPSFRYLASIGGDIHNYQRYPVRLDGRTVQHVVSGGGGAFMHATHLIPKIDPAAVCGVTEDEFRCYPLRRDSLAAYSRVMQGLLSRLHINLKVQMTSDEAAVFLAGKRHMTPLQSRPVQSAPADMPDTKGLSARARLVAQGQLLFGGKGFHKWFSPFYDWDSPPFYKQFLRIDVTKGGARVTCFGVTGCGETEDAPPMEDQFELSW